MPVSMWLAYIFSLTFGLAAIVSLIACPAIIKRYQTFDDYLLQIIRISERINGKTEASAVEGGLDFDVAVEDDDMTDDKIDGLLDALAFTVGKKDYDATVHQILKKARLDWDTAKNEKKRLRYTVGGFYIGSFLLGGTLFFVFMPISLLNL